MKSFTKFFVLTLAMFVTFGMMAQQQMTELEFQVLQQKAQQELAEHGPTGDVVFAPKSVTAQGDDCTDPIVINFATGGSWSVAGETTCGRLDDYDATFGTCVNPTYYTNGEDLVYQLVVANDMWIEFNFDPVETYSSLNIMESCPDVGAGNVCVFGSNTSSSDLRTFQVEFAAGTYYIQIDSWPSPDCVGFDLDLAEWTPPPAQDPITSFPYMEDFEACDWPATMLALSGSEANATVTTDAGFESSCGALLEGGGFSGWYNIANCSGFDINVPLHNANINLTVEPEAGAMGAMQLDFDMQQFYSFATNYNAFRVMLDDGSGWVALAEKNSGEECIFPTVATGDGFKKMIYSLTDYQGLTSFDLRIDFAGKYTYLYYQGGDAVMIDNVQVWYVPAGNVEGNAFNGTPASPEADVEIGFVGDDGPYAPEMTDAAGYYRFNNIETEPIDTYTFYGYKDGLNYVEQDVTVVAFMTTTVNWNMAAPLMVVTPAVLEETMNPNEWRSVPITITNGPTGGPLHWTAEIVFGEAPSSASSISVPAFTGEIPAGLNEATNGLAPKGFGTPGQEIKPMSPNGIMAIGYEAIAAGTFSFDVDNLGGATQIGGAGPGGEFFGGMVYDMDDPEVCYGITFYGNQLYSISPAGVYTLIATVPGISQTAGMGVDLTTGIYYISSQDQLWTVDVETGASVNIGSHGTSLMIAFSGDGEGNLWGYDMTNDVFHSIDKETGAATAVGSLGINVGYAQSMFYDQEADRVIAAAFNLSNYYTELRHMDVTTGASVILSDAYFVEYTGSAAPAGAAGGGGWLDLSAFEGDVPAGESNFVSALFNATGTTPGQVWTADIMFTAQPNISTATVDVSMIIAGEPLVPATDLEVELVNMATGQVDMSWTGVGNAITFEYYLVRRDGAPVANTQGTVYTDMLPDYGEFCYSVSAVYTEGESVPAGPECVVWLIPELCYSPDPVQGYVWVGFEEVYPMTLENCGEGVLAFDFTGFDDPMFSNGFVTSVEPNMGQIAEGESMVVNITMSAVGLTDGSYSVDLDLMTNELTPDNERMVACELFVYTPAMFNGTVTDCDTDMPIANATVRASSIIGDYYAETDASGYYEVYVDALFDPWGAYFLEFSKLSYESNVMFGYNISEGETITVDATLCETPYAVQYVYADPNELDTQCMVTWSLPMGPYEIIYDDGSAENYFAWIQFGGAVSVKFTPAGYPAMVAGGRLYVGDGSFPDGANFIGSQMAVGVLDDDGADGMPGTVLDSVVVTVNDYGWVEFPFSGSASFDDGNFYIAMWQLTVPPFSPPVGVDEQNPVVYRSYTKQTGGEWMMSAYNDFMIRATVFGPGDNVMVSVDGPSVIPPKPVDGQHIAAKLPLALPGTIKAGEFRPVSDMVADQRGLEKYKVAFVDGFDPNAGETPIDGTLNTLGTTGNTFYNHTGWGPKPAGFYAYAVQAMYTSSESIWVYSNVVAHKLDNEVTVNVSQCDNEEPSGAIVMMHGFDYPYQMLSLVTPPSGTVVFDSVIDGKYTLSVNKLGYQLYEHPDLMIVADYTEDVILQETEYPPRNLYVDPLTSVATWDEPLYIQVPFQGFEGDVYPPAGWTSLTSGIGWEQTSDGSSSFWTIPSPPAESEDMYIVSNDDQNGGNNGCCDYMITPMADLREASDYVLSFLSYFDGAYGQLAFVEYTTDGGATWEVLIELAPGFDWEQYNYDLSDMSGPDGLAEVWFAFHADDGGAWASGWAVDNIYVGNGPVDVYGYYVYLDEGFVAATDADTRTYEYGDLSYGTTYTAAVAALFGCNLSDKVYYTFTSGYLYPPRNLTDAYVYNTNEVPLYWNPPMTGDGVPMNVAEFLNESDDYATIAAEYNIPQVASTGNPTGLAPAGSPVFDVQNPVSLDMLDGNMSYGYIAYDPGGGSNGLAEILLDDPNSVTLFGPAASDFVSAADWVDGEYYGCIYGGTLVTFDFDNNSWTTIGSTGDFVGMAYVNSEATMYGLTFDGGLYTVDLETGATVSIGTGVANMIAMACDNQGNLYGVDLGTDTWGSIDKETGAWTVIGSVGFDCSYAQDAGLDRATNTIFWAAYDVTAGGKLCILDTETGSVPLIGGFPNGMEIAGFAVPSSYGGGGPGGGEVPAGLLAFNVYQDDVHVGSVNYMGEGTNDTISFVHNPVDPGCYDYNVTAVYDLAVYGFAGETGESVYEGPDTVCVVWGFDLPFMETWDEGTFDFNKWTTPMYDNWDVASQFGNGAPSAQFNWDPDPGADYSASLVSAPMNADLYTEGQIWMDFEYYLNNRTPSGTETLAVEIYNGQEWTQVWSITNMSSMDWTPVHVDITAFAMSRVFQVRFTAMGANSFDVINWNVDNIYIYRACEAPTKLDGDYQWITADSYGAEIWWEAPYIPEPPKGWLRWDDGTLFSGIGLTDGGDWTVAIRWDAGQLADYAGTSITKIQVAMNDESFDYINLKIWSGANASTLLWTSANENPIGGVWTEYTVDPPIALNVDDELWVGYDITNQGAGDFPAGTDGGPAVAGYGDKITTDGVTWDNLSDFGLDYNWTIAAYVETLDGASVAINPLVSNMTYDNANATPALGEIREVGVTNETIESTRAFSGFNVYRMGPDDMEYSLIDFVAYEEGATDYGYFDENPYPGMEIYNVCYQVTSVWESDTDYCESMPATSVVPIYDFVCVDITSINNSLEDGMTALYPNPASDRVTITSTIEMSRITIINYVGQVIYTADLNEGNSVELNTGNYDAGVYVVRIDTENGIVTKRLAIAK